MDDEYDDILQNSEIMISKTLSEAEVSEQPNLKSDMHVQSLKSLERMDTVSKRYSSPHRNSIYDPNQLQHNHEETVSLRKKNSFLVFGNDLLL